jgi:hypothetical protein
MSALSCAGVQKLLSSPTEPRERRKGKGIQVQSIFKFATALAVLAILSVEAVGDQKYVVPRSFQCEMKTLSKTSFAIKCTPNCKFAPETRTAPPAHSDFDLIRALTEDQTTPAIWHRACDGSAKS